MEELTVIKFTKEEIAQVPLLWNAMYGGQGIKATQLRVHNSVLEELEKVLGTGFAEEPVYEVLQMTQGKTTLAIHRINAETAGLDEITLNLNKAEHDYLKNLLSQISWAPAVSRIAEKLSVKFGLGD